MNLRSLSDQMLLSSMESLVAQERDLLTSILHHLREIEARKLFCDLGYSSLFDYATRKLGYSNDQAQRRISAMRALKEIPQIEEKIESGALSLTTISMAQSFFRAEKVPLQKKIEILRRLEHKSTREAEKVLLSISPKPLRPEKVTALTEDLSEMRFLASTKLQEKLKKLKGRFAHSNPNMSLSELIEKLADLGLEEFFPSKEEKPLGAPKVSLRQSYVPKPVRRQVFRQGQCKCSNCGSTYALEIDHIRPLALGGDSSAENLRLLCRSCNQRAAIKNLGLAKIGERLRR